jgi:hypothetical protein
VKARNEKIAEKTNMLVELDPAVAEAFRNST